MAASSDRLDSPTLYEWDLNENSTRYDYPRSWPEADVLRIQFSILATINAIVALASFVLITAILKSRITRKNPFNLYLLFIAIPDCIASSSCFLTCVMSAPESKFFSEAMCGFQAFYLTFAFAANAWMNAVIVHQIHKLLRYSQQRRRYFPPTRRQALMHALVVYVYAFILGILGSFHIRGFPLKSKLYYGLACFPMEYDTPSTYFFYLVFVPCLLLLPCLYTLMAMIDILWNKLLPSVGKRRKISLFLLRLIGLYFIAWLPFVILLVLGNFVPINSWIGWGGAAMSHLQGVITCVVVYFTNDDIRHEIRGLLCCKDLRRLVGGSSLDHDDDDMDTTNLRFQTSITTINQQQRQHSRSRDSVCSTSLSPPGEDDDDGNRGEEKTSSLEDDGECSPTTAIDNETVPQQKSVVEERRHSDTYDDLLLSLRKAHNRQGSNHQLAAEDAASRHIQRTGDVELGSSLRIIQS